MKIAEAVSCNGLVFRTSAKVFFPTFFVGRCAQAIYGYTVDKNIGFATVRAGIPEGTKVTVGANGSPATVTAKKFC